MAPACVNSQCGGSWDLPLNEANSTSRLSQTSASKRFLYPSQQNHTLWRVCFKPPPLTPTSTHTLLQTISKLGHPSPQECSKPGSCLLTNTPNQHHGLCTARGPLQPSPQWFPVRPLPSESAEDSVRVVGGLAPPPRGPPCAVKTGDPVLTGLQSPVLPSLGSSPHNI